MNKQISKVWAFRSDSNPNVEYETLQFVDVAGGGASSKKNDNGNE